MDRCGPAKPGAEADPSRPSATMILAPASPLTMSYSFYTLLALFIAFRLFCAALVQTYSNPDEFWQAPEVAHSLVYGNGHRTWEWWPEFKLRSFCHPILLAAFMATGEKLRILRSPLSVAAVPKVVHSCLAAVQDVAVVLLALKLYASPAFEPNATTRKAHSRFVAVCTCFALVFNWFLSWGMTRPFVNSLEASLSTVSLLLWVIALEREAIKSSNGTFRFLFLSCLIGGLNIGLRPTAAIPWVPIALHSLWSFGTKRFFARIVPAAMLGGLLGLGITVAIDSRFFGSFTFPLFSFLQLNLLSGVDRFYGSYSPYWYIVDGVPATVAVYLPMAALGVASLFKSTGNEGVKMDGRDDGRGKGKGKGEKNLSSAPLCSVQSLPAFIAAWYVFVLSLTSHKEHRFLLPIAGIVALYAGRGIFAFLRFMPPPFEWFGGIYTTLAEMLSGDRRLAGRDRGRQNERSQADEDDEDDDKASLFVLWFKRKTAPCRGDRWFSCAGLTTLALVNVIAIAYFNGFHQRGAVAVARHLALEAEAASGQLAALTTTAAALKSFDGDGGVFAASAERRAALAPLLLSASTSSSSTPALPLPLASLMGVHFLMQCHSTPYHSVIHNPLVQLRQLDCSPPIDGLFPTTVSDGETAAAARRRPQQQQQLSEAALWRKSPLALLRQFYGDRPTPPLACSARAVATAAEEAARLRQGLYRPSFFDALARALGASEPEATIGLPTHVVTFDADVDDKDREVFASWLEKNGFLNADEGTQGARRRTSERAAASFFFALHGVDAHQEAARDPSRVVVFEHECWRQLRRG